MTPVHVDFQALDLDQLYASGRTTRQLVFYCCRGIAAGLLLLAPAIAWYAWHRQGVALAMIAAWFVVIFWRTNKRARREFRQVLSQYPAQDISLLPEGLLVAWKHESYQFVAWQHYDSPQLDHVGMALLDTLSNRVVRVPRASFAEPAQFEAFAAQVTTYHRAAQGKPEIVPAHLRRFDSPPRYVLDYQLAAAEDRPLDSGPELERLFPQTLPAPPEEAGSDSWGPLLIWLFSLATLVVFLVEQPPGIEHSYSYFGMTSLVLLGNILIIFLVLRWLGTRGAKSRVKDYPAERLSMFERGYRSEQRGNEFEIPWTDMDAVVHHAGQLTLWRQGVCLVILPDRVFASAAAAAECAVWIRQILLDNQTALTDAERHK